MGPIRTLILLFTAVLVLGCEKQTPPAEKSGPKTLPSAVVEREKVETRESLPPEVKIKLKKDGKDQYSWELSGSDAEQVLKVNEKLKKRLAEPPK
jgi:hypothetical protein